MKIGENCFGENSFAAHVAASADKWEKIFILKHYSNNKSKRNERVDYTIITKYIKLNENGGRGGFGCTEKEKQPATQEKQFSTNGSNNGSQ